jgi:hypothetical protein
MFDAVRFSIVLIRLYTAGLLTYVALDSTQRFTEYYAISPLSDPDVIERATWVAVCWGVLAAYAAFLLWRTRQKPQRS